METEHRESGERGGRLSGEAQLARSAVDAAMFAPLVEEHSTALHGHLARRAPQAADDLLAETWLQAFSTRRSFDATLGTARGWLFGVARHVLHAHLRRSVASRSQPEVGAGRRQIGGGVPLLSGVQRGPGAADVVAQHGQAAGAGGVDVALGGDVDAARRPRPVGPGGGR